MRYYAEVNRAEVARVVVADSAEWCAEHLGGAWVEVADPYDTKDERTYPGPGYGYDDTHPALFAPKATADEIAPDAIVWHKGRIERADMQPELAVKVQAFEAVRLEAEQVKQVDGPPAR